MELRRSLTELSPSAMRLRALDYRFMASISATRNAQEVYAHVAGELDRRAVEMTEQDGRTHSFTLSSPAFYGLTPWVRYRPL
jgi:hypothetical protein